MELLLSENLPRQQSLSRCLEMLRTTTLKIGLPEDSSPRNRFLLSLHQRGSPIMRIPPRPFLAPALAGAREELSSALASACEAAQAGDESAVAAAFASAGETGVAAIRQAIDDGLSPGNTAVTIHGGWIYNRPAGKSVYVEGKGFDKPLYHTGELYNAFTYQIKVNGS